LNLCQNQKKISQLRLEQLAFFASVLVGLEVAMVTLALAVAHSLTVADVKTVSSEISVEQSDTSSWNSN